MPGFNRVLTGGTPTAVVPDGTSSTTTALAPIVRRPDVGGPIGSAGTDVDLLANCGTDPLPARGRS